MAKITKVLKIADRFICLLNCRLAMNAKNQTLQQSTLKSNRFLLIIALVLSGFRVLFSCAKLDTHVFIFDCKEISCAMQHVAHSRYFVFHSFHFKSTARCGDWVFVSGRSFSLCWRRCTLIACFALLRLSVSHRPTDRQTDISILSYACWLEMLRMSKPRVSGAYALRKHV